jgi:hypothetical protein
MQGKPGFVSFKVKVASAVFTKKRQKHVDLPMARTCAMDRINDPIATKQCASDDCSDAVLIYYGRQSVRMQCIASISSSGEVSATRMHQRYVNTSVGALQLPNTKCFYCDDVWTSRLWFYSIACKIDGASGLVWRMIRCLNRDNHTNILHLMLEKDASKCPEPSPLVPARSRNACVAPQMARAELACMSDGTSEQRGADTLPLVFWKTGELSKSPR